MWVDTFTKVPKGAMIVLAPACRPPFFALVASAFVDSWRACGHEVADEKLWICSLGATSGNRLSRMSLVPNCPFALVRGARARWAGPLMSRQLRREWTYPRGHILPCPCPHSPLCLANRPLKCTPLDRRAEPSRGTRNK